MEDRQSGSGAGRIAIKLGPAPTSQSRQPPSRTGTPSTLGKRQRPHGLGDDSDSDHEHNRHGRHEAITSFGSEPARKPAKNGSAGAGRETGKALVIEGLRNRDWRSRRNDQRRGRPPPEEHEGRQNGVTKEVENADASKPVKWGLSVSKKTKGGGEGERQAAGPAKGERPTNGDRGNIGKDRNQGSEPQDVELQALDALMGKASSSKERGLVITQGSDDSNEADEGGRYAPDVGEVSTLADYEAVDTEEFGAALLRGMGWDGKHNGELHEVKRRPNLMGLGAKKLDGAEELGSWNQKAGKPRPPRLNEYNREEERRREKRRERERDRDRERVR